MSNRVEQLLNQFESLEIEALLLSSAYNRRYISGFTGSSGYVYLSKTQRLFLTDFRYMEQAQTQCPGFKIVDFMKRGLVTELNDALAADGVNKCGYENKTMTVYEYSQLDKDLNVALMPLHDTVEEIRMIKDAAEIASIKAAATIGDKTFSHIISFIKPGMTELEIALEMEYHMKKLGATKLSFDTIVASGTRSSLPHAQPSSKKLEIGDFVTLDFGCIYEGYCSDMTRTFVVGKASVKQKQVYQTVAKAQLAALEALKAGLLGVEVDKVARDVIEAAGYGAYFGHGLGHSLGLEVHENPRLSPQGKTRLVENMIVTVEPGVYIPDFGGVRIEDLVCVTHEGYENFCTSTKELIEL